MERTALTENSSRFCECMHVYINIFMCIGNFFPPKKIHFTSELKKGK
jgi:hypothetical protein